MAETALTPTGVSLNTSGTTVYASTTAGPTVGFVRFCDTLASGGTLNAWVLASGATESDARRFVPKNYTIPIGGSVKVPFTMPANYSIVATASVSGSINGLPFGTETT